MTKRLLLPLLLLTAHVAVADIGPTEARSRTQVSRWCGELRPEPPPPKDERTRTCVVLRPSRPTTPQAAGLAPSFIDAEPVAPKTVSITARRFDGGAIPRPSAPPSGLSPSRAPPLA